MNLNDHVLFQSVGSFTVSVDRPKEVLTRISENRGEPPVLEKKNIKTS